jgi:hypothetical protein
LIIIQSHQILSQPRRSDCTKGRVSDDRNKELRVDGIQNKGEADQINNGRDNGQKELQRKAGKTLDVFANPLIGIVHLSSPFQSIIHSIFFVQLQCPIRHPFSPMNGQSLSLKLVHGHNGCSYQQRTDVFTQDIVKFHRILGTESVPKVLAQIRKEDTDATVEQRQTNHAGKQPAAGFGFFVIWYGHVPKQLELFTNLFPVELLLWIHILGMFLVSFDTVGCE